jgi:hypothetical protein
MKITRITSSVALLTIAVLAGCSGSGGSPAAAPTVTHTVIKSKTHTSTEPAPAVTKTVYKPAPTVTKTVQPAAPQPSNENSAAPAAGANHVITRFSGTGDKNTAAFTTPSRWHLSWAYWGCPGGTANFIVDEHNADGTTDFNGISVNELGKGRGPVATHAYGDAGSHYFTVTTEGCHWSLVPVTG